MATIRRAGLLAAAVAAISLGAAAPASADFHGLCTGPGSSLAGLTVEGSEMVYTARLQCPGATSMSISPVGLSNFFGSVALSSHQTEGANCAGCEVLEVTGRAPAGLPGLYRVAYQFSITSPTGSSGTRPRSARYLWLGVGAPIQQCGGDHAQAC